MIYEDEPNNGLNLEFGNWMKNSNESKARSLIELAPDSGGKVSSSLMDLHLVNSGGKNAAMRKRYKELE